MRVAILTPYWHPVVGGITTYVSGLAHALESEGEAVEVLVREGNGRGASVLGGSPRQFAARAKRRMEQSRPDVILAQGHWYALSAGLRARGRSKRPRVFFTFHTEAEKLSGARRSRFLGLLNDADGIIVLSTFMAGHARGLSSRTPVHVIPPGVSLRRESSKAIEGFLSASKLDGRRPIVAFVGPLSYRRKSLGVSALIQAMRGVRARIPAATLLVVGQGEHRVSLEREASESIPGGFVFLDSVSRTSLVYSACDVYAHISFQETFGLATLEAMACGAPVVATRVGGVPDLIRDGETGIIVSQEPAEITDALLSLIANPEKASELGRSAAEYTARRYPWGQIARQVMSLYSNETGGPEPRG